MNPHHYNVVPECYADTLLVELIGFTRPNHALNSNLAKVLSTIKAAKPQQKIVGIIDEDGGRNYKFLKEFEPVSEQAGVKLFQKGNHTILVISPVFEDWVFENARMAGVNPDKFGFKDKKYFRKCCKSIHASRDQQLKNFFNTLYQKRADGLMQLQLNIMEALGLDPADYG